MTVVALTILIIVLVCVLPATGVPWSAKHAVIRIGGANVILYNSGYDIDPGTDWDPTDHMDAAGFKTSVACMERAAVHIEGWLDATGLIWDAPLSLIDGSTISAVKCYTNGVGSPFWSFPLLNLLRTPARARTNQAYRYEIFAETQGQWFLPTGVVPTP